MTTSIPVVLVSGFLGAGKTTMINDLLRSPEFVGAAVLVNELGDISLDHDLIAHVDGDMVSTTTGCLCCTASGDVQQALFELWNQIVQGRIAAFSRVIVEATGLVDPAPVLSGLLAPPVGDFVQRTVVTQFSLSRFVTLFDIVNGDAMLEWHLEARKQVALADVIVLTKTDLSRDPGTLADIENSKATIAQLNPGAAILDRHDDWDALKTACLASSTYDLRGRDKDGLAWLGAEGVLQDGAHEQTHPGDIRNDAPSNISQHGHHGDTGAHDPNRHAGGIMSHCIVLDEPITPLMFQDFLDGLKTSAGPDLLRMKGLFRLTDDPERPIVAHGVQRNLYPIDRLEQWPSEDKRTRIVLIGKDLNIDAMCAVLKSTERSLSV